MSDNSSMLLRNLDWVICACWNINIKDFFALFKNINEGRLEGTISLNCNNLMMPNLSFWAHLIRLTSWKRIFKWAMRVISTPITYVEQCLIVKLLNLFSMSNFWLSKTIFKADQYSIFHSMSFFPIKHFLIISEKKAI